ncbi:hypothetical protein CTA2_6300 [Colletotrichum tanaceti]|uniref:N-acetyltransferase domain-containing protein n=1 Tax=Colletotrichum tanaceti TaxID=1306861 RepID=A0A4U6X0G5_9PEZI|nr:hypothetical protein CTA2_6300 [Colletotrichum tanaceti]TKW48830.1 hypothetical protein CTA1_5095 [Colletotrichum tanaceti]
MRGKWVASGRDAGRSDVTKRRGNRTLGPLARDDVISLIHLSLSLSLLCVSGSVHLGFFLTISIRLITSSGVARSLGHICVSCDRQTAPLFILSRVHLYSSRYPAKKESLPFLFDTELTQILRPSVRCLPPSIGPRSPKNMAFIRPYKSSDFAATGHICRATLPPSLERSEAATRTAPYLWTHQFTLLSPETCHILDDGHGTAVGYCIGCANVDDLAEAYPRYVAEVLEMSAELAGRKPESLETRAPWTVPGTGEVNEEALLQQAFNPAWLVLDEARGDLWGAWRATMHIDLLGPWQGQGWGRRLVERFVESLREADRRKNGDDDGGDGGARRRRRDRLYGKGVHIGVGGENGKVVPFYEKLGFRVYPTGEKGSIWMTLDVE